MTLYMKCREYLGILKADILRRVLEVRRMLKVVQLGLYL